MIIGIPTMILVTCLAAFLYFGGSFVFGIGSINRVGYLGARGGALGAGAANATRGLGGSEVGEGAVSGLRGSGMVVARGFGGIMFARSLGAAVVGGTTGFEGASSTGCWIGEDVGTDACARGAGADDEGAASAFAIGAFTAAGRIGATGAGPGTGGRKGCSGSVGSSGACAGGAGADDEGTVSAFAIGVFAAAGRIGATGAGPGTGGRKGCSGSVGGAAEDLLKVPVALTSSKILLLVGVTGVACCAVLVFVGAALGADVSFFVL